VRAPAAVLQCKAVAPARELFPAAFAVPHGQSVRWQTDRPTIKADWWAKWPETLSWTAGLSVLQSSS